MCEYRNFIELSNTIRIFLRFGYEKVTKSEHIVVLGLKYVLNFQKMLGFLEKLIDGFLLFIKK